MGFPLDDEAALCSIEILAEAVEMAFVPGILELRTLRDALNDALRSRSPAAIRLAFSAYTRVDRDFRDRISHHALSLATLRRRTAGPLRGDTPSSAPLPAALGTDGPRRA
ncbi:hypothetical protein [Azospirillum sp. TSO35-2]|uniref:hypothetical protein n=1 Tax=Azospirillum sp. TSO35-2 TaxID=716796 RepID=UPI000D61CED3|nr:hypothetical protein [Azospirillum sp. TSO35-2]PWC37585.1 hypothetical protein TSO352_08605 [Azospirillum sp. TSO35-2]